MATVSDLLLALDSRFPFSRAESWDKTGLQIGDASASINSVLVAYEITDAVLNASRPGDCLVVYHPLLFRPLENLDFKNHTARLAARILGAGQSLISVHTALDGAASPGALGDALAQQLGLKNVRVLKPSGHEKLVKIVVFVPEEALEAVSTALWSAGAGSIGRYDEASFRSQGTGTFRPLEGASPYSGEVGVRSQEPETRLEVIGPEEKWPALVVAMKKAHPYEEVAYDVFPLLNSDPSQSYGPARIGEIDPLDLADFATIVQNALQAPNIRLVRAKTEIKKVVCSPGSGASFIAAAARAGADCLVSGDIKHHDALQARALGLSIIDVTHANTERATIPLMAQALANVPGIEVRQAPFENPFS